MPIIGREVCSRSGMSVAPRDDRWLRPSREIRRSARLTSWRRWPIEASRSGRSAPTSITLPLGSRAEVGGARLRIAGRWGSACPVTTQALSETLQAFELDCGPAGNEQRGRIAQHGGILARRLGVALHHRFRRAVWDYHLPVAGRPAYVCSWERSGCSTGIQCGHRTVQAP